MLIFTFGPLDSWSVKDQRNLHDFFKSPGLFPHILLSKYSCFAHHDISQNPIPSVVSARTNPCNTILQLSGLNKNLGNRKKLYKFIFRGFGLWQWCKEILINLWLLLPWPSFWVLNELHTTEGWMEHPALTSCLISYLL